MIIRIGCLLLLLSSPFTFSANGLIENNGLFGSLGAGFTPIYIEEVTQNDVLSAGATVTAVHTSLQLGSVFNNYYAAYLLDERNWYIDNERNIYLSGLTGLGLTYLAPDFHQFYLTSGIGFATKTILGTKNTATGWGILLGIGRPINNNLALDVSYSFLNLSKPTPSTGDGEAISSLQLSISYRWH